MSTKIQARTRTDGRIISMMPNDELLKYSGPPKQMRKVRMELEKRGKAKK